ncbi:MAG: ABC transporter permease subunit [Myxococcales bacterium]|nr:ABC transporter permease subunit [Myxococcales bacterium]
MKYSNSIRLVASFDLLESLKSRKAVVLLSLYMVGALGASGIFIRLLGIVRERLAEEVGQAIDTKMLMENPGMARLLGSLTGDAEVGRAVASIPPIAIFYGWLAMNFVPLLVLFTSADAISGDVASGAVRYSLFRTDRLSWAIGKLIGQTCLMALGVLVGALACWATGMIWLDGMPPVDSAVWLLRISGRAIIYSFAYLGMVMCASQLTRTNARAGGLALLLTFVSSLAGSIFQADLVVEQAPGLFRVLSKLVPAGHHLALWHPGLVQSGSAMFGLISIGLAFFALGFWRFSTRDA